MRRCIVASDVAGTLAQVADNNPAIVTHLLIGAAVALVLACVWWLHRWLVRRREEKTWNEILRQIADDVERDERMHQRMCADFYENHVRMTCMN